MEKMSLKDFAAIANDFMHLQTERTCMAISECTEVNYGTQEDCDVEWCIEHNVPTYNLYRKAGCCVSTNGNILIADIRHSYLGWVYLKFLADLKAYLSNKGIENIVIDHNDVLIDGYKACSAEGQNLAPDYTMEYTGIQISINQDLYVIEHACKKPMKKQPKGLGEYGITTDEMVTFCEDWFDRFYTENLARYEALKAQSKS